MIPLLALIVALIPLAIAPGLFFYFDVTPKIVLLLLGTAVAVVWWTVTSGSGAKVFAGASREAGWFLLAMCGMALSLTISTLTSVNPALSLAGSAWRYWGLVTQLASLVLAYVVAACCAGRPDRIRVILRAMAASGLIGAVYGIAQYFGWDPFLDARGYRAGEGIWTIVRPPSTLGHADYFANWLLAVTFAGMALALTEGGLAWRWLAQTAVAAGSAAIVLSGTRAAMIGLLAGALFLILWRGRRLTRRVVAMAMVIALSNAAFYVSPAGQRLRARVHWALEDPAGGARFLLWRDSLRMAASHWPAGYGPETFTASFARHQSADLGKAYPDFYHESPHNIFLDVLVAQGVAGLLALSALCAAGFAAAWKARWHPVARALAAGLAAMTISEEFASFTMPTAMAYYVTIALLVSLSVRAPLQPCPVRRRWPRVAVAALCASALMVFSARLCMAESALAAVRRDLDGNRVSDAARHYAKYQSWRWPGDSADLWYSRRLVQLAGSHAERAIRVQAFQQAGLAAERAIVTDEAPFNAYYNLAAFYARENDFIHTTQCLNFAISCAPNWFKPHYMLAQVLQAASRLREAQAEAATAAALDGGKHPEVTGTLEQIRSALPAAPTAP